VQRWLEAIKFSGRFKARQIPRSQRSLSSLCNQRVVFVGRLSRTKGVHYLLKAMRIAHQELPKAVLVLLGEGHDSESFVQLTDELGLNDVVTFLGWADRETVQAELARSTVVAFPSIYPEAFGISGIEAMAHGKPVVGFDVGGGGRLVEA